MLEFASFSLRISMENSLSVDLAPNHPLGLKLRNPVLAASGTFGWSVHYGSLAEADGLGAIVTNGTTLESNKGPQTPRIVEVTTGLVNAFGWANPGIDAVIREMASEWAETGTEIILSVVPSDAIEAERIGDQIREVEGIGAVELDITRALDNAAPLGSLVESLRASSGRPVIVKIPGVGVDLVETAKKLEEAGADAIAAIQPPPAMVIDVSKREAVLADKVGGLVGPAVKPIALYSVWTLAAAVSVPIIGVGGISTVEDALEFLMAGASAVEVGSATFRNPRSGIEIVEGIKRFLDGHGMSSVADLVGAAGR